MKIYFAGLGTSNIKILKDAGIKNKLYSYSNEKRVAERWGREGLMLDSGAFSVFTKGISVNIDELIAYIKRTQPEHAIQLDVIGNDEKTWQNFLYMKRDIPEIIPVIHYRASEEHIKRVLASSDYILLGGLVPLSRRKQELFRWCDHLYSRYKLQNKKIHMLGITTKSVLERYPVYSSDSSSWTGVSRYPSQELMLKMRQKTLAHTELYRYSIESTLDLERYITKLWKARGITWD